MTALAISPTAELPSATSWRRLLFSRRILIGGGILLSIVLVCFCTLPMTLNTNSDFYYDLQHTNFGQRPPQLSPSWMWFGTTKIGQSLLGRCLTGGCLSLVIGFSAAAISVLLGVTVGLIAGYRGGWLDSLLMRIVDVLYSLPYILLVILFKIALERPLSRIPGLPDRWANVFVLLLAIGLVSWLTMARVIRGQVLSLRSLPFIEAARAAGLPERKIFIRHLLPNLVGPITVYATLTIPSAILQESMLSFLGIGIQPPLPTWGSLASESLDLALNPIYHRWWLLVFPCTLLAATLLSLNFLGDGLRDAFDPKRTAANI